MAYTKNTWATDDIITADKLNNLENGINQTYYPVSSLLITKDTNALTTPGKYGVDSNFANIPTNLPNGGVLEMVQYDATVGYQTLMARDSNAPGSRMTTWVRLKFGSTFGAWEALAKDAEAVKLTGDQIISGNKTFSGTTNTTGYLKQKRWSTTVSIGGNTIILNRIGDVVFASGTVTTTLNGGTSASGTLPTGFRPFANFVVNTNRGIGSGTLLFQQDGSVWVPATINVDSYISGTYLAQDILPTI